MTGGGKVQEKLLAKIIKMMKAKTGTIVPISGRRRVLDVLA